MILETIMDVDWDSNLLVQLFSIETQVVLWTENGIERHRVLGTRICYEPNHVNYTRGIEVQQAALSGK